MTHRARPSGQLRSQRLFRLTLPFTQARAAKGFAGLTILFLAIFTPTVLISRKETHLVRSRHVLLRLWLWF